MAASPRDAIPDRQDAVDALYATLFPARTVDTAPRVNRPPAAPPPDDARLLDRAQRAKNGALFARLWRGDTSGHAGDDSSADLALCNLLAFWAGPDPARLDGLFRQSGLYREKWDRADYRTATIAKALEGRTAYYDWDTRGQNAGAATFRVGTNGAHPEHDDTDEGADPPDEYPFTDTGNGDLFATLHAGQFRYDHRRGMWYRWAGHWWRGEGDRHARLATAAIARLREQAAASAPEEHRKAARAWAKASAGKTKRDNLLSLAGDTDALAAPGDDWDRDPFLLGVANGVIDLRTGALHPGAPDQRITRRSPVPCDPAALCPRWERFLLEIFRDDAGLVAWLQRMIGYSLTGDTGEHLFVVCFGNGSNGKSTLFTVLRHLLGDYGGTLNFSALAQTPYEAHPTELAALLDRRFVTASEINEGQRLNEARIKALTGGDAITARFMRQDEFTFRPILKLWLAVNHKPIVADDSRGFWRRMRLLPFLREFPLDQALEGALLAEAPGILAWAVRGCLAWQAHGLGTATAIDEATDAYRQESDPLGAFLAACCTTGDQLAVQASALYRAYQEWAGEQGQREKEQLNSTTFGRRIGERFARQRANTGNIYRGVALSSTWQDRQPHAGHFER